MHNAPWIRHLLALLLFTLAAAYAKSEPPFPPNGDVPSRFERVADEFDFERRDVMIPMRDGVKLHTIILIPKSGTRMPMLLSRTPYSADRTSNRVASPHLAAVLNSGAATNFGTGDDVIAVSGYIRVVQDVRGRFGSEGDYVMLRPLRGPLNPSATDHSTDTWDTIDWLVKNVPESNGRVGLIGTSYPGGLVLMGLVNPHPALKAAVPINPVVDDWRGDDWFHNGAFRQQQMEFIYRQSTTKNAGEPWWTGTYDDYERFLSRGSAGDMGRAMGMEQLPFWRRLIAHPAYDQFWRLQAMDRILAAQPLKVATLFVDSLWDAEDIYGAGAAWRAMEPKDAANDMNFLAVGPWQHGGANGDGSSLGALKFNGDTGYYFRRHILQPFLDEHLKEGAPKAGTPPVLIYETGSDEWRRYDGWPLSCEEGCPAKPRPLYLEAGGGLGFSPPQARSGYDEYISDPAKPVPYRVRPVRPSYSPDSTWSRWLVDDQRVYSDRPDVLTYMSEVLTEPLTVSGHPMADLYASTSGTDSDWVVKLIDVYPAEMPSQPAMGGYQLAISMDILRGRYRDDPARPTPIPAGKVQRYRFQLPKVNHVFQPGHRIMVQIQSSWFPLYDRNPQSFVDNIFNARPGDYRKATQRVFHQTTAASNILLPVVRGMKAARVILNLPPKDLIDATGRHRRRHQLKMAGISPDRPHG